METVKRYIITANLGQGRLEATITESRLLKDRLYITIKLFSMGNHSNIVIYEGETRLSMDSAITWVKGRLTILESVFANQE